MEMIKDKFHLQHPIFSQLEEYIDFYDMFSISTLGWIKHGIASAINFDTYVFSSMKGTLESIKEVLKNLRIADAYALLRRYYDSTIINVYTNLYLEEHFNIETYFVPEIEDWLKGKKKIPEYRIMSQYIRNSSRLSEITSLLFQDERYKDIRNRCNEHTHYNFYRHVLINDNEIYHPERMKMLDKLGNDVEAVFIQHLAQIFYLNDHYMMSSDYADYMDMGLTPPEGSQYFVASFIQDIFNKVIRVKRPDVAEAIKAHTSMALR